MSIVNRQPLIFLILSPKRQRRCPLLQFFRLTAKRILPETNIWCLFYYFIELETVLSRWYCSISWTHEAKLPWNYFCLCYAKELQYFDDHKESILRLSPLQYVCFWQSVKRKCYIQWLKKTVFGIHFQRMLLIAFHLFYLTVRLVETIILYLHP
jgi:hypothetical protein